MFRRQRSRSHIARSKSSSFSFASFFSGRTRCSAERAVALKHGLGRRLFVEELEDRRMLAISATLNAFDVVTFTGNAAADTLILSVDGAGNLMHNRFTAGDPGYASDIDLDSTIIGVQSRPAFIVNQVVVTDTGTNDTLQVQLGAGVVGARLQAQSTIGLTNSDVLTTDTLPDIQFANLDTFRLFGAGDQSDVTFVTESLDGAANYEFDSVTADATVVIEGNDSTDDFFELRRVTAGPQDYDIVDVNAGVTISLFTFVSGFDRIEFQTLGGDDTVTVNVDAGAGSDVILVPVLLDGGSGNDLLQVTGNPTTTIDTVDYTPGLQFDEGRLEYYDGPDPVNDNRLMAIYFDNLEPIVDDVMAGQLRVFGNGANNAITYDQDDEDDELPARGKVEIDGFESIVFENKTELELVGNDGDDIIVVDNAAIPAGLQTIVIHGDDPQLTPIGASGNDQIRILSLPDASATSFVGVTVFGNEGDDVIDASLVRVNTPLTLNGEEGDDTITGGAGADTINGGADNDTIIWSPGNDSIDGGTGDDGFVIRGTVAANNVSVTQQAVANLLVIVVDGANGADTVSSLEHLRVELGDGNDQLTIGVPNAQLITSFQSIFYDGGTGANTLTVQGAFGAQSIDSVVYTPGLPVNEGRLLYTDGAQVMDVTFDNLRPIIDTADAAELTINGNGVANSMTAIQDPAAATRVLASVDGFETMSFNNKANFTLNGLAGDDTIVVDIATAAVITGLTSLRVNGNDGNDEIRLESLPTAAAFTTARVDGGAGNDVIDASQLPLTVTKPLTLNGEEGNDTITGGPGLDTISGGAGDDIIIASPGNDVLNGDAGNDQIHIIGTILADTITANQTLATTLVVNVTTNAVLSTRSYTTNTLEKVLIDGREGDDLIAINVVDTVTAATSLPFEVIGNSPNASDRLIVNDDGLGDLVLHNEGPDGRSGSVLIGPTTGAGNTLLAKPKVQVDYYSIERVDITPLNVVGQTGTDAGGRLIVFKYDTFETNESISNATAIGPLPVFIGQRNINPGGVVLPAPFNNIPGDADWYEFRPGKIGTFRIQALFEHIVATTNGRPGLPGNGDLRLDVYRPGGTLIASSNSSGVTPINVDSIETIDISTLADTSYFIRVQGASTPAINIYNFNVTEVDDDGPQVFDPDNGGPNAAIYPNNLTTYNLFDPKPVTAGPSTLIHSITINVRDLPLRAPGDPYPALDVAVASQPGLYSLVGDHLGNIDITSVTVVNNPVVVGQQATATITLHFARALPDDRFTLTILDGVVDPPGNNLDGESNADEPGTPTFPSGNTIEGGDFVARFTVDTRPEIGAAVAADIDIDINGNYYWDPNNSQIGNDHTNVDLSFTLLVQNGASGPLAPGGFNVNDLLFAGKFTNGGVLPPRLFDQLAAFGYSAELGSYRWLIDTTGDGVITIGSTDLLVTLPGGTSPVVLGVNVAGAIPIAGNFDNNAANGDEIGLYTAGKWLLDTNHSFTLDTLITGNMLGAPVVGDFDGNGSDDLAVFNNNVFSFDLNRNGFTNASLGAPWGFPGVLDKPIAADMDQDGIDDIGLWAPRDSASIPREVSEWYFLVSGTRTAPITTVVNNSTIRSANLINATINPGDLVRIRSGAGVDQVRTVQSFAAGTGQITFTSALAGLAVGDIIAVGGTQNSIVTLNHAFNTSPFGNDIAAEFGDERALPIVGNFDPPTAPTQIAPAAAGIDGDFTGDSMVDGADFLSWQRNVASQSSTQTAGQLVDWQDNYGAVSSAATTAPTIDGDFTGDSLVDGADLLSWQRNVASQSSSQTAGQLADWQDNYGAAIAAAASGAVAGGESVVYMATALADDVVEPLVRPMPNAAALEVAAPAKVANRDFDFVMLVNRPSVRSSQKPETPVRDAARHQDRDAALSNWNRRELDRVERRGESYFDDDWKIAVRGEKIGAKRATPEELEELVFAEL